MTFGLGIELNRGSIEVQLFDHYAKCSMAGSWEVWLFQATWCRFQKDEGWMFLGARIMRTLLEPDCEKMRQGLMSLT